MMWIISRSLFSINFKTIIRYALLLDSIVAEQDVPTFSVHRPDGFDIREPLPG